MNHQPVNLRPGDLDLSAMEALGDGSVIIPMRSHNMSFVCVDCIERTVSMMQYSGVDSVNKLNLDKNSNFDWLFDLAKEAV